MTAEDQVTPPVTTPAATTAQQPTPVAITTQQLTAAARTRVFFGHQSVGMNLLRAVPGVFAAQGLQAPPIGDPNRLASTDGGIFAHVAIGRNQQPLSKIDEFDARIRGGIGAHVDVAMMKLCYVDVTAKTDVTGLFTTYHSVLTTLARDFPHVRIVATTVPLTTAAGLGQRLGERVRALLGRGDWSGPAANMARGQMNELVRSEFSGANLFDLAAVESTTPQGERVCDEGHFALYDGYASDNGHLNQHGAQVAAAAWLSIIAGPDPR